MSQLSELRRQVRELEAERDGLKERLTKWESLEALDKLITKTAGVVTGENTLSTASDRQATMLAAYNMLVEDDVHLCDPDQVGENMHAAVHVNLERDGSGEFYIDVRLNQLEGAQIGFVLSVARIYELEVREESGWMRLSRHLNSDDALDVEEPVMESVA